VVCRINDLSAIRFHTAIADRLAGATFRRTTIIRNDWIIGYFSRWRLSIQQRR
jgi:hypothetical protein